MDAAKTPHPAARALLLLAALVVMPACRIGDEVPFVGEDCDSSVDCGDDNTLGCVATNPDNPTGNRVCMPPPDGWDLTRCKGFFNGDEDHICDCGCGAHDVDCADETAAVCDPDKGLHCPDGENPVADDNAACE